MINIVSMFIVALGGNQRSVEGPPEVSIIASIEALGKRGATILARSKLYRTPCFPKGAGPDYVNAAVALQANWTPQEALMHLHAIESDFGRERILRWGQRTLDMDLIACNQEILPDMETFQSWQNLDIEAQKKHAPKQLILPHPRVQDRAFVLMPMNDVAPDWVHPVSGLSVSQMLDALPDRDKLDIVALRE